MEKETNIFERILKVAGSHGFSSINKFAIDGLKYKSSEKINRLKNPKNKPSFEIIRDITTNFKNVNTRWLITGEGEMKNDNTSLDLNYAKEPSNVYKSRTDTVIDNQKIPLYEAEAVAGIVPVFQDLYTEEPIDYLEIPHAPKCDGAMYASGDSMYPIVKSGDILGYKEIKDMEHDVFPGHMYILYLEVAGDLMRTVKYVQKGKDENYLKLVSENRHHEPKEVHKSKIKALAQVKLTVRIN